MYVLAFKNVTSVKSTECNAGDTNAVTSLLDVLDPFGILEPTIWPWIEYTLWLKDMGKDTA